MEGTELQMKTDLEKSSTDLQAAQLLISQVRVFNWRTLFGKHKVTGLPVV